MRTNDRESVLELACVGPRLLHPAGPRLRRRSLYRDAVRDFLCRSFDSVAQVFANYVLAQNMKFIGKCDSAWMLCRVDSAVHG